MRDATESGRRMRVAMLFLYLPPEFAGGALQGLRLMRALGRRGVEVTALASMPRGLHAPLAESAFGGEVRRFRTPRAPRARMLVASVRAAWWLLLNPGWDVLHLHGSNYHAVLPVLVARLRRRPVILKITLLPADVDVPRSGLFARIARLPLRCADAIVALSDEIDASLERDAGVEARVVRIANGVDTELFRPPRDDAERKVLRRVLGLPDDAFVVVTCGMLNERKNGVALIEAGARLASRPVHLVLAGPPGTDAAHARRVDAAIAALPDGVVAHRLGQVEPDDVASVVRAADVLTLTSRSEGMPNSLLEGMASGLPCIATDVGGSRDVLADGGGVLVPLDDVDALARAIDRLLGDAGERRRLGDEARRLAEERHSAARIADRYVELYAELGSAERPATPSRG